MLDVMERTPGGSQSRSTDGYGNLSAVIDGDYQLMRVAVCVELATIPYCSVIGRTEAVPRRDGLYQILQHFNLAAKRSPAHSTLPSPAGADIQSPSPWEGAHGALHCHGSAVRCDRRGRVCPLET